MKKYVGYGVQSDKERMVRYLETSLPSMTTSLGTGDQGQVNGPCVAMCTTTVSKLPLCGTLSLRLENQYLLKYMVHCQQIKVKQCFFPSEWEVTGNQSLRWNQEGEIYDHSFFRLRLVDLHSQVTDNNQDFLACESNQ